MTSTKWQLKLSAFNENLSANWRPYTFPKQTQIRSSKSEVSAFWETALCLCLSSLQSNVAERHRARRLADGRISRNCKAVQCDGTPRKPLVHTRAAELF